MRLTRIYTPQALAKGATIELDNRAAEHCARVLRMRVGDPLILFNGEGGEYEARLDHVSKSGVTATVGQWHDITRESPLRITLCQALARGERMDYALQKAVELGVSALVPVITRRCVVQLKGEKQARRMAHWQGVITSACEQSGRTVLPALQEPMSLADLLATRDARGHADAELRLVLDPDGQAGLEGLDDTWHGQTPSFLFLVGPEGGLEEDEIAACKSAGFHAVRLGPRVLRTETAGAAMISTLQARWGDFRDRAGNDSAGSAAEQA